jgi:arylsulfatase
MTEFPPRQRPESWSVGDVMEKLQRHKEAVESGSGVGVK